MLVQKSDPTGIDIVIAKIQGKVWNHLTNTAGWTDYNSYERVYKNPKGDDGRMIPELYEGNGDYREIYMNDNELAESYFVVEDNRQFSEVFSVDVGYIFQVNLEGLYPSVVHRADEEAHKDAYLAILSAVSEKDISNLTTTIDDVYREFHIDQVRLTDMQPCHVFRYNFTVHYQYLCCK